MRPRYWCPLQGAGSYIGQNLQVKSLHDTPSPSCSKLQTAGPRCRVYLLLYSPQNLKVCCLYSETQSPSTPQRSLYVPQIGHYMYRPVVTICTAQWSLYVPPSGQYMYRPVSTISSAQWLLYEPHSGHYMYRPVVTICTASLPFNNSTFCPHTVFICFVWISEQTAIISLHNINWLVFITETESVYCAVRTGVYVYVSLTRLFKC